MATLHFCLVTQLKTVIKEAATLELVLITEPNFSSLSPPYPPEVYHLKENECVSSVIDHFQYHMASMVR